MSDHLSLVARSLRLDYEAGVAVEHLRAAGVPSILLKGAAIATWLYQGGEVRPYQDVDLLVSPSRLDTAIAALAELGYADELVNAHPAEFGPKERELVGPGNVHIDLHHGLIGVSAPSQRCWDVLVGRTTAFQLTPSVQVQVLDPAARAMHLALHAAQNGPIDVKALADLERGLGKLSREEWGEAARVAEQLEATEAFAAGLRLLPGGERLAEELALPRRMTVELALRTRSAPQDALFFERLAQVPGARGKAWVFARKVFPTAALLHANSPLARRGRLGLLLVRLGHPLVQAGRLGPALVAWFRARRAARRSQLER
ncbi:MAG TPA: nucleotidyltransferase family protein [Acidimicrobiales bacterium]|nr:nucleotidyltransferase family protein [Acidimicrobiales bacterium]